MNIQFILTIMSMLLLLLLFKLGDLTGSVWLCPSEALKQQLQANKHNTISEALQSSLGKGGLLLFFNCYY